VNEDYDDPIDALAELFAEPDPGPEPRFVELLESQLRVAHAEQNRAPATFGPRWGRLVGLATVAVVVLAAATAGLVYRDRSVSSALEMSDASGVSLTLPDGSTIDDPADGFELPNGTVIVIKIGGSAVVDDVVLGEGAVVTVRDGALVTDAKVDLAAAPVVDQVPIPGQDVASPTPAQSGSTGQNQQSDIRPEPSDVRPLPPVDEPGPPAAPSDPGRPPMPTPRPSLPADPFGPLPPVKDGPTVTIEPKPIGPPITSQPGPIGPPVSGPPPMPVPPPADSISPPSIAPAPGLTVPVGLRVSRHGHTHRVKVVWSSGQVPNADWRAIVIRSTATAPPEWPAAGATVVVGESPAGGPGSAVDDVPPDALVARYRVVLIDRIGAVVASSVVQTVNLG